MTAASMTRPLALAAVLSLASPPAFGQTESHTHQPPPAPAGPQAMPAPQAPHGAGAHEHPGSEGPQDLPPFIPRLTDADRQAAFPDVEGHAVHDKAVNAYVLFDQLEWQVGGGSTGVNLDSRGWLGRDRDRLWFRAEGNAEDGRVDDAEAHVLYGRQFARWWDVVGGVRQDFRPGPARTWAAIGVQGLAPYWFEVEATAYFGASGRTHARVEVEYELLLTNRLILQPLVEADVVGKSDPERGVGAGLSTTDVGFRLRYEGRREVAPYLGVTWARKWGRTADLAEDEGRERSGARFVFGLRMWF